MHCELSTSQKQAVITQIEKKDKGLQKIDKKWTRPIISLVSVGVKIGSRVIAMQPFRESPSPCI